MNAHAFSTPVLVAWDTLRVLVIGGGLVVMAGTLVMIARTQLAARMALAAGLSCFMVSAIGTELEHLSDGATYRLFFNLAGVALAGVGTWLARRET